MADFRKPRFGGGNRDGGRGGFGGPRREERELFQTTCSNCNKECEVPFRPNGKKPVFCKDCFVRTEGDAPRSFDRRDAPPRSFERRDAPRSFDREERPRDERPAFVAPKATPDPRIDTLSRDVEALTRKIDTVIDILRARELHTAIEKAIKPVTVAAKAKKVTKKK